MTKRSRPKRQFIPTINPPPAAATNRFVPSKAYLERTAALAPPSQNILLQNSNSIISVLEGSESARGEEEEDGEPIETRGIDLGRLSNLVPSSSQPASDVHLNSQQENESQDVLQDLEAAKRLKAAQLAAEIIKNHAVDLPPSTEPISTSTDEESSAPPHKRVKVVVPSAGEENQLVAGDNLVERESTGLGDFSKVYEFIKTRSSPKANRTQSSTPPIRNPISPPSHSKPISNLHSAPTTRRFPSPIPIPSYDRSDIDINNISKSPPSTSFVPSLPKLSTTSNYISTSLSLTPASIESPNMKTETSKASYVRPTPVDLTNSTKAIYERSLLVTSTIKYKPLTLVEKSRSLPQKLETTFPLDTEMRIAKLYSAGLLKKGDGRSVGPIESSLFGFWPGEIRRKEGKGLYPAPVYVPIDEAELREEEGRGRVEIFIDNSNIVYSFLNWLKGKLEGVGFTGSGRETLLVDGKKAKFDYHSFFALLERGRKVEKRIMVASSPLYQGLEVGLDWGYEISILQRVPRPDLNANAIIKAIPAQPATATTKAIGPTFIKEPPIKFREQCVDELLHLKILESLLSFTPSPSSPKPTLVLATGDANNSEYNPTGFIGCARKALERGWNIEIVAFDHGTSTLWLQEEKRSGELADEMGDGIGERGRLKVIDLAGFGDELVL